MTGPTWDPVAAVAGIAGRSTRAIVDLDAIARNIDVISHEHAPEQSVCAVVKANGYGHGAVMVARAALATHASMLAVATVGEAADLRGHDIHAPILILGPIDPSEIERALRLECDVMVGDRAAIDAVAASGSALAIRPSVHLKVDTGMHRFGCAPGDAVDLARLIDRHGLRFAGIATHFASADEIDSSPTDAQQHLFLAVVDQVISATTQHPLIHQANSAGTLKGYGKHGALIRLGIAMYGLRPGSGTPLHPAVRPALSVISRLARVHVAHPGDKVSYGGTYCEDHVERLGLVPIGYADGYPRLASSVGWFGRSGHQLPVRGRVCMDQTVVGEVLSTTTVGDWVGIMGPLGGGPTLDDVANWAGTINYEIATSLSPRVTRHYVRGNEIVARLEEGRLHDYR